jgi:type 1 glutamine amidotransferase
MHGNYVLSALLAAGLVLSASVSAAPAPKLKVLLVTGDDVVPAHNWRETSQATREVLAASGKFDVFVCEDAAILESAAALKRYDVIYLMLFNIKTPTLSDPAKENLLGFVKGGKGFVLTHLASASFKEWDDFKKLCGRYWVMGQSGHGARGVFKVTIKDATHPITQGLEDFEADDELYSKLQGDAPIHVLATADSDFSKKTEPLVFTVEFGAGRVFHYTLGHDVKAIRNPSLSKLIVRGCEWAATGAVTP